MSKRLKLSNNLLIESIRQEKWTNISVYLHEANLPDSNKTYALHEICMINTAPIKIVEVIYHAYPEAASIKNSYQDTPISIAVDCEFESAVHFLTNVCPESCSLADADGYFPLQSLIYNLRCNNMIDSIIKANPRSAFIIDDEGDSAFDFFFHQWNILMRIAVHYQIQCDMILDRTVGYGNWKIHDIYDKTCLFLKAASIYRNGKTFDDAYLLHWALREKSCHMAYCKFLLRMHPDQILKKDLDGNLPIHIIAASKESSDEKTFICLDCFTKGEKLSYVEFFDGESKYCCDSCLETTSEKSRKGSFSIRPGT